MTQATELITAARGYAQAMVTAAQGALGDAIGAVEWAREPSVTVAWANLPDAPDKSANLTLPTMSDVPLDLPSEPAGDMVFQDLVWSDGDKAPEFSARAPNLTDPSQPSALQAFSERPPTIELPAQFPQAPDMMVPEPPTETQLVTPTKPNVALPSFAGHRPSDVSAPPSNLGTELRSAYSQAVHDSVSVAGEYVDAELLKINPQYHSQLNALEDQLTKYLEGGTGLNPVVEDAIYARARSKNDAEARRVRDQALADAAARGFTMPTGALLSATQQARQAGADANATAAREIVVMQAEMEQKNLQFAVTTSAQLRTAAVGAALSYMQNIVALNGQAVDYAKGLVNAMVETYNAVVKAYSAKLEGYKADAQVYQSLLQASLTGVEVYKAEIQAMLAMVNVDQAKVATYRARVDVLTALSGMYKTQVEAVVSQASLERLKVDLYQANVQAYSAEVNAKTAEWQGYAAQLSGNSAKVQAYTAEAQAYSAQVQGYKARVEAQSEAVKAAALTNDARAKQYVAKWDGYKAVVSSKGEVARTKLENQRQEVIAFQAQSQAAVANAQVGVEYYKATGQIGVANAGLLLQSSIADVEAKSKYIQLLSTLHTANATVHANLAGSAMAGMNALAVEYADDA